MSLVDLMRADAVNVFLQANDFAETVTYVPHRHVAEQQRPPREIKAVVIRNQVSVEGPDERVAYTYEVRVANDSVYGISSDEVDTGGDMIELSAKIGEAPRRRAIQYVAEHDEGMLVLMCR